MRIIIIAALLALMSCGTQTRIVQSWKDPDATVNPDRLHKVMVAVLAQDESSRRRAEDKMAEKHPAFIPSYTIFDSPQAAKDENVAKQLLSDQNFDGVVILRLINKEEQETYVPGSLRRTAYWNHHGIFFYNYYTPGYFVQDETYILSTNAFSLKEDKLLWSGVTSTLNPANLERTIDEVMQEVKKQMVKDGFIRN